MSKLTKRAVDALEKPKKGQTFPVGRRAERLWCPRDSVGVEDLRPSNTGMPKAGADAS